MASIQLHSVLKTEDGQDTAGGATAADPQLKRKMENFYRLEKAKKDSFVDNKYLFNKDYVAVTDKIKSVIFSGTDLSNGLCKVLDWQVLWKCHILTGLSRI